MNPFSKKNPALEAAKKLHKAALMGQLKAQQDLDWAQSMILYHTQRAESLAEFIAKIEALDQKAAPAIRAVLGEARPAFTEPERPAPRRTKAFTAGGLTDPTPVGA